MASSRFRSAVLVVLLAAAAAAAADETPEAKAALDAAVARSVDLTAKFDYSGALDALKDVQKKHGAAARAETAAARVYMTHAAQEAENGEDGNLVRALYADAMTHAKKALAIDPECAEGVVLASQSERAYGDLDGARAALTGFLEKHPQDVVVRWEWAKWNYESRQWADAERELAKIVALAPNDGRAVLWLTVTKQQSGAAAIDVLEKGFLDAARLLPEQNEPLQRLADLHPKDKGKRVELLRKVVAENPKAVWARVWIGYVLRKEAPIDAKGAVAVLREAAALAPDNAASYRELGMALEDAGETADAVAAYTTSVEKSVVGGATAASDALDRLLFTGKGVAHGARDRAYDAIVAKNPEVGRYGNNAGFWYRDVGKDYEKSLKYYLASVRAQPDEQDYLNDTGLIYLFHLESRREKCLPLFEHVLKLVEKDGEKPKRGYWDALENLCKYWFEKGEFKKVIECADKRASPDAELGGRPYPSRVAAGWKERALSELEKK